MPNVKGGKNYKKSKHVSATKPVMFERQPGQMYGRIIKNVGGDRMLVFCNDCKIRSCHICGSMRKKVWMKKGDLVLFSLRDLGETVEDKAKSAIEVGDIIAKYDDDLISNLKKLDDFNHILLKPLENAELDTLKSYANYDSKKLSEIIQEEEDQDGGIVFDRGSEDEEEEDTQEEGVKLKGKEKATAVKNKGIARKEKERAGANGDNDDVNIDDI